MLCIIRPRQASACDRYANHAGTLVRVDPDVLLQRTVNQGSTLVPFGVGPDWDGSLLHQPDVFVTAIGAGTTYPDYKPAPLIVASQVAGVDTVTVVTEGIFIYCGLR